MSTKMNVHALLLLAALVPVQSLVAQDPDTPASLMLELENALPRKVTATNQPVSFGQSIDWDETLNKVGEVLARSAGNSVEPHALFILGGCQFNAHEIDAARATFEDLQTRFPTHSLVLAKDPVTGRSFVENAIEDCIDELTFRRANKVVRLPRPELDEDCTATLHLSAGDVKIQFYKNVATKHRENFLKLAKSGFYDRTRVHRLVPGHLVQMGCPHTRDPNPTKWGKGDPGYVQDNEFSLVSHGAGTLTMWRGPGRPKSHGCQFQIMLKDQQQLDFVQTPFAKVIEGLEYVDQLSRQTRNQHESPVEHCWINGITVTEK